MASSTQKNKTLSWILLIALSIFWGTSFILIKKALLVFTPIQVGSLRIFLAGLALLPVAIVNIKKLEKNKIFPIFLSGFIGFLIPAILFAMAGSKIDSSLSGALNSITPIFVIIIGFLFFKQQVKTEQLLGIGIAIFGSLLLILQGGKGLSFNNPYALVVVGATICYGFNVHILGTYLKGINAIHLAAWTLGFVMLLAAGIALGSGILEKTTHPDFKIAFIEIFLLGAVNSGLMSILFNRLMQVADAVVASSVTYLIPIVAIIVGALDQENISVWLIVGILITLVGVWLINRK
jgi:drug/metabolite transporter (DMT)-like permease